MRRRSEVIEENLSLRDEMATCLSATGADLGDEVACILALTSARYRAIDINVLLDDVIEAARVVRAETEHFPEHPDAARQKKAARFYADDSKPSPVIEHLSKPRSV